MIDFIMGLSQGIFVAAIILGFIALVSQMSLYAKAGQPAISALVPVWNVIVFCKVVGRPAKQALFLIVPGLVILAAVVLYWPQIDGLFPVHGQGGELEPGPTAWSDVTVPFAIIGAATLPLAIIMILMFIEVCDSFGKHSTIDKVLCVVFNGFYILFALGISSAKYEAPWWARKRGLPYYMPDFKHKGKKYLVTPDGPLVGDPRDQKVKVEIVDENDHQLDGDQDVDLKKTTQEVNKIVEEKKEKAKAVVSSKSSTSDGPKKSWREEMKEKYKKK